MFVFPFCQPEASMSPCFNQKVNKKIQVTGKEEIWIKLQMSHRSYQKKHLVNLIWTTAVETFCQIITV